MGSIRSCPWPASPEHPVVIQKSMKIYDISTISIIYITYIISAENPRKTQRNTSNFGVSLRSRRLCLTPTRVSSSRDTLNLSWRPFALLLKAVLPLGGRHRGCGPAKHGGSHRNMDSSRACGHQARPEVAQMERMQAQQSSPQQAAAHPKV